MTRPVLYLDFDGVLNDVAWISGAERNAAIDAYRERHRCSRYEAMCALAPLQDLRPELVAHVRRILDETDARLIVCSSWRSSTTDDDLRAILARVGLPFDGTTPRDPVKMSEYNARQRDIRSHVATLEPGTRWCVLDDDVSEREFPGHVVRPDDGVTAEQADVVVQILLFGAA